MCWTWISNGIVLNQQKVKHYVLYDINCCISHPSLFFLPVHGVKKRFLHLLETAVVGFTPSISSQYISNLYYAAVMQLQFILSLHQC